MRRLIVQSLALLLCGGVSASVALARREARPYANMYGAVVLCDGMAEDTAAHVRLVEYGNGQIIYRCVKGGW